MVCFHDEVVCVNGGGSSLLFKELSTSASSNHWDRFSNILLHWKLASERASDVVQIVFYPSAALLRYDVSPRTLERVGNDFGGASDSWVWHRTVSRTRRGWLWRYFWFMSLAVHIEMSYSPGSGFGTRLPPIEERTYSGSKLDGNEWKWLVLFREELWIEHNPKYKPLSSVRWKWTRTYFRLDEL